MIKDVLYGSSRYELYMFADKPEPGSAGFIHPMAASTRRFLCQLAQAAVKGMSPDELKEIGADIILGNTYHLFLRPG